MTLKKKKRTKSEATKALWQNPAHKAKIRRIQLERKHPWRAKDPDFMWYNPNYEEV